MDAQLIIDYGHGIVTHLACADGMVGCLGILLYPVEQLVVFIQINPGMNRSTFMEVLAHDSY